MTLTQTLPAVASIAVVVLTGAMVSRRGARPKGAWILPAITSALFLGFSLWTIVREGPLGFWAVHTSSLWGNQVWFDLLLAVSIGWSMMVPEARKAGMWLWAWLALVLATGCIGFLAMVARLLYLRERGYEPEGESESYLSSYRRERAQ